MGEGTEISDTVKDAPEPSYRQMDEREDDNRKPPPDIRQMPRQIRYIVKRPDYNF